MNIQQNIRKILREESQKQSRLLSNIEEDGLYQVMQDTGLSLKQIKSKIGEIPREVFEVYIKDYFYNELSWANLSIQISPNKIVDSFYLSNGVVTIELNEVDSIGRVVAGSFERLSALSDEEIFSLVNEMSQINDDFFDYRNLQESENKKPKLLSNIEEDGLYQIMKDTSLSLPQVISKTGELSREVLERYIKDFVKNEAESIAGSDGDIGFVFPIPLSKNKEVESFYLSKGKLTLEIKEYDSNGRVVMGSHERLVNLSDSEINRIVKELIDWGEDTYYEI